MKKTSHGGDLDGMSKKYNIKKEDIIDFSGNINPLGFPEKTQKLLSENLSIIKTYPDKNYTNLKKEIANYVNIDKNFVTVGNGTTQLISIFIKSINAEKTVIIGPAYYEYEKEASLLGGSYFYFQLKEENNFNLNIKELLNVLKDDISLLIICNPNNPTGTVINNDALRTIAIHCMEKNISIMIDETYIEFSQNIKNETAINLVDDFDNIFVIRGTSKFFASPGIRLGYGVCKNQKFLDLLNKIQEPWSVNILASFVGENIYKEEEFIQKTKKLMINENKKCYDFLVKLKNVKVYKTSANFILLKILDKNIKSSYICDELAKEGIIIRNCESFEFLDESFIRFCFLMPKQNDLLLSKLKKYLT